MRKVIIHTEQITKPLEKFCFQVKIPKGANSLNGIHVSVNAPLFEPLLDEAPNPFVGDLELSAPMGREHFYTELVRLSDIEVDRLNVIPSPGTLSTNEHWIEGDFGRFFDIIVDGDNTLIEGFFESKVEWNYELKIYLEFDV